MSIVTNIMICGIDVDEHIDEVNKWLTEHNHYPIGYIDPCNEVVGGESCLEIGILVGAFKYLKLDDFILHLKSIEWGWNSVDLFVKEEHDDPAVFRKIPIWREGKVD